MNRHDENALVIAMFTILVAAMAGLVRSDESTEPTNPPIAADFDADGDVDLEDYAVFLASFSGPVPLWLQDEIAYYKAAPPMNPPVAFYRYRYEGKIVFYRGGYCCDFPSKAWTAYGNPFCQPGGGISGTGDGLCPNFFDVATDELLIWQDDR